MKKEERSIDSVEFIQVQDATKVTHFADKLLEGAILCLDFRDCVLDDAKEALAFLSGVIYALDGTPRKVQDNVFLFAKKIDYRDGSLRDFLNQYGK